MMKIPRIAGGGARASRCRGAASPTSLRTFAEMSGTDGVQVVDLRPPPFFARTTQRPYQPQSLPEAYFAHLPAENRPPDRFRGYPVRLCPENGSRSLEAGYRPRQIPSPTCTAWAISASFDPQPLAGGRDYAGNGGARSRNKLTGKDDGRSLDLGLEAASRCGPVLQDPENANSAASRGAQGPVLQRRDR